jgi:hypothetical protein
LSQNKISSCRATWDSNVEHFYGVQELNHEHVLRDVWVEAHKRLTQQALDRSAFISELTITLYLYRLFRIQPVSRVSQCRISGLCKIIVTTERNVFTSIILTQLEVTERMIRWFAQLVYKIGNKLFGNLSRVTTSLQPIAEASRHSYALCQVSHPLFHGLKVLIRDHLSLEFGFAFSED